MATVKQLLRGCIRRRPTLPALEEFMAEETDVDAMVSYYEHHYRVHFGVIDNLEHFLYWYEMDCSISWDENIPQYMMMNQHLVSNPKYMLK
ncbi:hypothetical protein XENTR_v10007959 [Xenopus tropicalis]|nr:hypothetical protein XENTR_v10007959 [Xenopus tropicalis]